MLSNDTRRTVALYARVSTLDQDCNLQLADLRRYAQQRFARYYEYVDVGVSGAQRKRPQLDALMTAAGQRLFDVVLVWKFDRFARSLLRAKRKSFWHSSRLPPVWSQKPAQQWPADRQTRREAAIQPIDRNICNAPRDEIVSRHRSEQRGQRRP
jgi:DNA invertase Pin-like site-specific DNA recombinase